MSKNEKYGNFMKEWEKIYKHRKNSMVADDIIGNINILVLDKNNELLDDYTFDIFGEKKLEKMEIKRFGMQKGFDDDCINYEIQLNCDFKKMFKEEE